MCEAQDSIPRRERDERQRQREIEIGKMIEK
jgi:hypothetical protein